MESQDDNRIRSHSWLFIVLAFLGLTFAAYIIVYKIKDLATLRLLEVFLIILFMIVAVIGAILLYLQNKTDTQSKLREAEYRHLEEMARRFNERERDRGIKS